MKTLKVMSIVSLVFSVLCVWAIMAFATPYDYEASAGWGIFLFLWTVAFSIVVLVKATKKNN